MGFIIVGVVLSIVVTIVINFFSKSNKIYGGIPVILGLIMVISIITGIAAPGTPIEKTVIDRHAIACILDGVDFYGRERKLYVHMSNNDAYTFYFEVDSEFEHLENEKSYKKETLRGDNIILIEYPKDSGEIAMVYKYESGYRANFWTFSVNMRKYEYVIRIPEGSILR